MKANICFKCHRFFEEDYLYCPYCRDPLKKVDFEDVKTSNDSSKKDNKPKEISHVDKHVEESDEVVSFYDTLSIWERTFIDTFDLSIKTNYPQIEMHHTKSYIFFLAQEDRSLENYGHWFYISKRDDKFAIRYRSIPNKNIEPSIIYINKKTSIQYVISTILSIISKRYGLKAPQSKDDDDEFSDLEDRNDKKRLAPRSDHSNILLTGDHPNDKFFGELAQGERKTQKEIWEVKSNYYKK